MSLAERFGGFKDRFKTRRNYRIMEWVRRYVDSTLSDNGLFPKVKKELLIPTLESLKQRNPEISYFMDSQIGRYLEETGQRTQALEYFERAVLSYPNPMVEKENFDQFVTLYLTSVRNIAQQEAIPFLRGKKRKDALRKLELLAGSTRRVLEEHPNLDQVVDENTAVVSWINSVKNRVPVQRSQFSRN